MVSEVLVRPTVAQMIAALQKYPPDIPLTIEDADTNWVITTIHIDQYDHELQLWGCYGEMEKG